MLKFGQKYYFSIRVMETHKIYHQSGHYSTRIWRLWMRLGVAHHSTGSEWGGSGHRRRHKAWLTAAVRGFFQPVSSRRPSTLFQMWFYGQMTIITLGQRKAFCVFPPKFAFSKKSKFIFTMHRVVTFTFPRVWFFIMSDIHQLLFVDNVYNVLCQIYFGFTNSSHQKTVLT